MYLYNLKVDFRWRAEGQLPPNITYNCRTIMYGWGRKHVLALTDSCPPSDTWSPTRAELTRNLSLPVTTKVICNAS